MTFSPLTVPRKICIIILPAVLLVFSISFVFAASKNGFELDGASIPVEKILHGGPPRDGIPAIDDPKFISDAGPDVIKPDDRILGVVRNGIAKAYPINILNWHEIVNDRFGAEGIVVTFCPLCGTGMAFKAEIAGEVRDFGVSGLLYNSDVLLYDRSSESLWSQIAREAVSGPLQGTQLEMVATAHTSWADWSARHPDSLVLSRETGHVRNYSRNPYAGYETSEMTIFPVAFNKANLHPKELVIGLEIGDTAKAYPFVELSKTSGTFSDSIDGKTVTVEYDAQHRSGRLLDGNGDEIPTVIAFWFAWSAFYPDTEIYRVNQEEN
jgi:hypothetical protein